MTDYRLRTATPSDARAIVDVLHRAFEEYRGALQPPSGAHTESESSVFGLLTGEEMAFVAEATSGELFGCVFYRPHPSQTDLYYLHRLAVIPEARGQGIASALIQAVEDAAIQAGRDYVSLGVRIVLTENRAYYLKRGYYPIAYAAHSGYAAPTYVTMRKRVSAPILRQVVIAAWTPAWKDAYEIAAAEVRSILGDHLLEIHHIGSTAITGMPAKPIIDLLGIVGDLHQVDRTEPRLLMAGWKPRGEFGIVGRRYFRKGADDDHTHHLHVYQQGNGNIDRQLRFVAYLNTHPEEARRYAELKQRLAVEHPFAPTEYTEAKGPLVEEILVRAMTWQPGAS